MWYKIQKLWYDIKYFLGDTKEFWILCILGWLTMVLMFYAAIKLGEEQCKQLAMQQNLEWDFGAIKGCLIKEKNGGWIDYEKYRVVK